MEHGGFQPEQILALSPDERTVWQAVAELNREQNKQDIRDAVTEAMEMIIQSLADNERGDI